MTDTDVIDRLAGLAPDSPLARIRDRKPITRDQAQASYRALFAPEDPGDVPIRDRAALAVFVAALHPQSAIAAYYASILGDDGQAAALIAEAERARTSGPYGSYPKGPLTPEDSAGPTYRAAADFGPRLAAAMTHMHMLVFHPRDANAAALQALLDAGWSNAGIVTISQLAAFLSFQIRTIAGLRVLAAAGADA